MEKKKCLLYHISDHPVAFFSFFLVCLSELFQQCKLLFIILPNLEIKALYNTIKTPTGATL